MIADDDNENVLLSWENFGDSRQIYTIYHDEQLDKFEVTITTERIMDEYEVFDAENNPHLESTSELLCEQRIYFCPGQFEVFANLIATALNQHKSS